MLNVAAAIEPGKPALLKLVRSGAEVSLKVTVGKRPKPRPRSDSD
jgi:hypothetical protein